MKSYKDHLASVMSFGEKTASTRKPVYRSSAVFPVLQTDRIATKLFFMGYWLKKRNIQEIMILITLRAANGQLLLRQEKLILSARAFTIELAKLLEDIDEVPESKFVGSIELEVYSTRDLVFPYPAFVLAYIGEEGCGCVHTTGRIYNDLEDYSNNTSQLVGESGFDVLSGEGFDPFFCFTNGPKASSGNLKFDFIDEHNRSTVVEADLGEVSAYETRFVHLKEITNLEKVLGGQKGTVKIVHSFDSFFPRFIAGNFVEERAVSITHSYYDNSTNRREDAYFNNDEPKLHDSSVFVPLFLDDGSYTELVYYPVYSPSAYSIDFEIYDADGRCLKTIYDWREFKEAESNVFLTIDLGRIIDESLTNDQKENAKGVHIINRWYDKARIPTRLKYGLNVGIRNRPFDLPTNICFAPAVANHKLLKKPGTFKWLPLINENRSIAVVTNSSTLKNYDWPAELEIEIVRSKDDQTLTWSSTLAPYSQLRLDTSESDEVANFLGQETGWMSVRSSNPFINAWYFDFHENGVVAGDHSF